MDLAKLVARLELETAKYQANMEKAQKQLQRFEKAQNDTLRRIRNAFNVAAGAIGVSFGVGMFTQAIHEAAKFGDEIQKAADKAGTSASVMSQFAAVGKQLDIELGTLTKGIRSMQDAISSAAAGSKTAQRIFAELGIPIEHLRSLKPEEQFQLLAEQISRIPDPTDRARIGTDLFSKAYLDLVPLLKEGKDGIKALREEQIALGNALSDEQLAKLAELDDSIKKLGAQFRSTARVISAEFAPAMTEYLELIERAASDRSFQAKLFQGLANPLSGIGNLALDVQLKKLREMEQELAEISVTVKKIEPPQFSLNIGVDPEEQAKRAKEAAERAKEAEEERFDAHIAGVAQMLAIEEDMAERRQSVADDIEASVLAAEGDAVEQQKAIADAATENFERMSVFADQAARNIQDAFADFLFDPFQDGLDGMLKGFIKVLQRMVAEAAAARIFESKELGGLGLGDFITDGIGALFGVASNAPKKLSTATGPQKAGMGAISFSQAVTFNNVKDLSDEKMLVYSQRISDATIARMREAQRYGRF